MGGRPKSHNKQTPGADARPNDDLALWRRVADSATPLSERSRRKQVRQLPSAQPVTPAGQAPAPGPQGPGKAATPARRVAASRPAPTQPVELSHGTASGLDRRSAERLRRGKLPVEASIDLHGLDQARAHAALERFLASAQAQGRRCVLVVTGKGMSRPDGGVLRQAVPRWLNMPPNRERVLSFSYAQPRDGGMGALYVLLRRRRAP